MAVPDTINEISKAPPVWPGRTPTGGKGMNVKSVEKQEKSLVVLTIEANAEEFELSDVFQCFFHISGESGNRLCDDHIDLLLFTHLNHPLEFNSVLSFHAAESFIGKDPNQFPFVIALYQLGVRPDLCGIRVELVGGIGGNTAIGCDLFPLTCFQRYRRNELS